jgi:hypothetical protein
VPARDVRLTVAGAGPVSFPVRAPQAKRMIACARPARFGRGGRTLIDLSVRDTWEITPDRVTLTGLDWGAILAEVWDELRLPARARLRARTPAKASIARLWAPCSPLCRSLARTASWPRQPHDITLI